MMTITAQSHVLEYPKNKTPSHAVLAKRHTEPVPRRDTRPTPRTPYQKLSQTLPVGQVAPQARSPRSGAPVVLASPNSSSSFRSLHRQYSGTYPVSVASTPFQGTQHHTKAGPGGRVAQGTRSPRSPDTSSSFSSPRYSGTYPVASAPFQATHHSKAEPCGEIDGELPCNSARFEQCRRQNTEVEPDVEPLPKVPSIVHQVSQAKTCSAHETLGTPLLLDVHELKQPAPEPPSRQVTKTCFRASAVLLLWAAAALLGLSVASMAQTIQAMQAATLERPQTPLDFTLRLARTIDKCLGVVDVKAQSRVSLQACSASSTQQFLLANDGTIRSRSDDRLCMTSVPGGELVLSLCVQSETQLFKVQPSGKLALQARPSECINLLYGDLGAGKVGLYRCSSDLNEVFVYGGGHFLLPKLEHEMSQVRELPPVDTETDWMQENLKPVCWFTFGAFLLSVLLMIAAFPKKIGYRWLYVMVLGFIAGIIVLICFSLLAAAHAMQESERLTDKAKAMASAQTADLDFTLRMTKSTDLCLSAGSLEDKSKVSLQQCKASAVQQFILQDDGTIHAKQAAELCVTVEQSHMVFLSPCNASKWRLQTFSKQAESKGWLQMHAAPSMCLNLLGGNEKAGNIGVWKCGNDLNEVFVYSGGNVAISGLALQVHKVRLLLKQASHHLEGGFVHILAPGGGPCFLLLAVPSLLLLAGSARPTSP